MSINPLSLIQLAHDAIPRTQSNFNTGITCAARFCNNTITDFKKSTVIDKSVYCKYINRCRLCNKFYHRDDVYNVFTFIDNNTTTCLCIYCSSELGMGNGRLVLKKDLISVKQIVWQKKFTYNLVAVEGELSAVMTNVIVKDDITEYKFTCSATHASKFIPFSMFSHARVTHISFTMIVFEGPNQWRRKFNKDSIVYEIDNNMMEDGSIYSIRRAYNYVNRLCDFLTMTPFLHAERVFCCDNANVECSPYSRVYENHVCNICDKRFSYNDNVDKLCERAMQDIIGEPDFDIDGPIRFLMFCE